MYVHVQLFIYLFIHLAMLSAINSLGIPKLANMVLSFAITVLAVFDLPMQQISGSFDDNRLRSCNRYLETPVCHCRPLAKECQEPRVIS